jgi:hypothetical protein
LIYFLKKAISPKKFFRGAAFSFVNGKIVKGTPEA